MAFDFSGLSENQIKFLETRQTTKTDKEAYQTLGQSRSTLARWKQQELFRQAYDFILHPVEDVSDIVVTEAEIKEIVNRELRTFADELPSILKRLFQIAKGVNPSEALRATKEIREIYGLGPEMLTRETLDYVQQQIQRWTGKDSGNTNSNPSTTTS